MTDEQRVQAKDGSSNVVKGIGEAFGSDFTAAAIILCLAERLKSERGFYIWPENGFGKAILDYDVWQKEFANAQLAKSAQEKWRDIATSSKDGEQCLTWNGRRFHVAMFDKVENAWVSSFTTVTKRLPLSPQPTHWMPLPPAPTTEAQS